MVGFQQESPFPGVYFQMRTVSFQGGYDGIWYIYSDVPGLDWFLLVVQNPCLGGGFKYVLFTPSFGEDSHFD